MSTHKSKRERTSTSSFGTTGRVSHDSSPFYNSRLYNDLPSERKVPYTENKLPLNLLDSIICASAEKMKVVPDKSIHLMITSPPYNVGKDYDKDLTLREYLDFLKKIWDEVKRILVPGGRACINVANLGRKPYIPLHTFIIQDMLDIGFLMRGEIIWNKAASASGSTAWGSWLSPSNPALRDIHEYILIFSKDMFRRENPEKRKPTIARDEFLELTKSVWTFPTESAKKIGHPAPFPIELPRRLIQLYTFEDEVVLDPFMGSGQTALAALETGRHYLGYEIDESYAELAIKRINDYREEVIRST
jgi:site-specific DNA-methyltransferase (adenine-specific)